MVILFLHGWQSAPGGVKPVFLRDNGHTVLNPKLPDDDFDEAVRIAQDELDRHHPEVIVGSSRGGAVAMNLRQNLRLVLLCPAWRWFGSVRIVKPGAVILHSRGDLIVPFQDSVELLRHSGIPGDALIETGSDHRLADPESLQVMLKACEKDSI